MGGRKKEVLGSETEQANEEALLEERFAKIRERLEKAGAEYDEVEAIVLEELRQLGFTFDRVDDRTAKLVPYPLELYHYLLDEIERGRSMGMRQQLIKMLVDIPVQSRREFKLLQSFFPDPGYFGHSIGIVFDNKTYDYPEVRDWFLDQVEHREYGNYFLGKLNHYVSGEVAEDCCFKVLEQGTAWAAADALATYGTERAQPVLESIVRSTKGETKRYIERALKRLVKRLGR
jgi:hypothetical protein